jgi:hypothetical protein
MPNYKLLPGTINGHPVGKLLINSFEDSAGWVGNPECFWDKEVCVFRRQDIPQVISLLKNYLSATDEEKT